jgi:hypothetical protein
MTGIIPAGVAALWLPNDLTPDLFAIDLGGNVLVKTPAPAAEPGFEDTTGMASDGTNLYLSAGFAPHGLTVHDKSTGVQTDPLALPIASNASNAGDLAFDPERYLLWRVDADVPALVRINPAELDHADSALGHQSFPLDVSQFGPDLFGRGVTYDSDKKNLLYVSLGENSLEKGGLVITVEIVGMDPHTAVPKITGVLFRKDGVNGSDIVLLGGLGYQPRAGTLSAATGLPADEGTLWVGGTSTVNHVTLNGELLATVNTPAAVDLVDGLEFISGT